MAPRRIAGYAVRALLVLVAGFIVFDLASSFAIAHGAPFYVALATGALACPIAPVIWHVLGERKRARKRAAMKKPRPAATTGLARLLLRAGAVGVAVIAGLIGLTQGPWEAVRHHALWFVPHTEARLATDSPLLALVPANAEAVWWARPTQAASDAFTALGADAKLLESVYALGAPDPTSNRYEAALITRFPGGSLPAPPTWLKALALVSPPALSVGPIATPLGPSWRATRGWAGAIGNGKPTALIALLGRAPEDSLAVVAAKIARPDDTMEVVGYVTLRDQQLAISADAELPSPDAAARFRAEVANAIASARTIAFTAVTCLQGHGATFDLTSDGANVHLRATLAVDAVRACLPTQ